MSWHIIRLMAERAHKPQRIPTASTMNLSAVVRRVIDLAKAVREYWERELPKRHPSFPVVKPGEEGPPSPPEEKQLAEFLLNLRKDRLSQLAVLMDLGRGDLAVEQLSEHYKWLNEEFSDARALASQLAGKATLADYLEAGLAELKKHGIDVDQLPPQPARARA